MNASELTNPSIVKAFKSNGNIFLYGKEKFMLTGRFSTAEAEIRHLSSGDISWIKHESPIYKELIRQWDINEAEKSKKGREKREAKKKILLELAKDSNMTPIEWRVKLLKEHGLLLTSRPYGHDYEVYKCNVKWNDSFLVTKMGKQNLDVKRIMKFCDSRKITNADPYHRFNDITIKEVLDKVIRIQKQDMTRRENETIKAIESFAG